MKSEKKHINKYFYQVSKIAEMIDKNEINKLVKNIARIKKKSGRIFSKNLFFKNEQNEI